MPDADTGPSTYRSGRRRARVAAVLLAGAVAVAVAQAIHFYDGLNFIGRARDGGYSALLEAQAFDKTSSDLAIVGAVVGLATIVAFLAWESRAIDNLRPLGLYQPRPPASPRAAMGWWFVPLANYLVPYRFVADLQRRLIGQPLERTLVIGWWIAWVGSSAFSLAVYLVAPDPASGLGGYVRQWSLVIAGQLVRAIAGVLAIVLVLALEAGARRRRVAVETPPAAPSPAFTEPAPAAWPMAPIPALTAVPPMARIPVAVPVVPASIPGAGDGPPA